MKEGNLQAPERQPVLWQEPEFWDSEALETELERVYDICHGCRRCVSLCEAFPTLFDLIDESDTLEVDGVNKADYGKVVDECYMCDLCAETKCPYLPPHEWAIDFPHLMLRAKAQKFRQGKSKWRDRLITSTDSLLGAIARPGLAGAVNALTHTKAARALAETIIGIHKQAPLPHIQPKSARQQLAGHEHTIDEQSATIQPSAHTTGKVALFVTCYGNHIHPEVVIDMITVLEHNGIVTKLLAQESCCGMPKLELGDLDAVARLKEASFPALLEAIEQGYDLMAPIPSCTLMFRQEIPLLFPADQGAQKIKTAFFDPFEYLMLRHKEGLLQTNFKQGLGKLAYHVACHQRVQRIGRKTSDLFALIPDTELVIIERCSGHDGTYAWKKESYEHAIKIAQPVVRQVTAANPAACMSDCMMAGHMIAHGMKKDIAVPHPLSLLRRAYNL